MSQPQNGGRGCPVCHRAGPACRCGATRERPILFSGPMVRAILEDRKTQTRRVVKHQPPDGMPASMIRVGPYNPVVEDRWGDLQPGPEVFGAYDTEGEWGAKCPYGQPCDLLWVRETHAIVDGPCWSGLPRTAGPDGHWAYYREGFDRSRPSRWRPSIHMPRWASRITLRVTDVRVGRLRAITEADAMAEGVSPLCLHPPDEPRECSAGSDPLDVGFARDNFRTLWDSINGERPGCSWEANPWVWVVSFEVVS